MVPLTHSRSIKDKTLSLRLCMRKKILYGCEAQGVRFPEKFTLDVIFTQLGALTGDGVCVTAWGQHVKCDEI